jgi:alpha-methylacyl-CoA racemase
MLKPLSGIKVLDFTAMPPGGACTVMLADLGADVIRVEPPAQKDKPSLVIGQVGLSRGKRSITLDLKNPASNRVLERLAPRIDVIVDNAKPGAMEARGFGYAHARAFNPRIVWCAITGFGESGPYADHAGHDLSYLAHSGLLGALSADRGWQPGISLSLQAGALCAVVGIQSALLHRQAQGSGAFVDISLSEAATWLLNCGIRPLSDRPLRLQNSPDRRLYACADGRHVAVACAEARTWSALCQGLGVPELIGHLHKAELAATTVAVLEPLFLTRAAADWVGLLAPQGAAVTIVNHADQIPHDPQVRARGSVAMVDDVAVPASPIRLRSADDQRSGTATEPPHATGADTHDVLTDAGYSQQEISALASAGVI